MLERLDPKPPSNPPLEGADDCEGPAVDAMPVDDPVRDAKPCPNAPCGTPRALGMEEVESPAAIAFALA